VKSPEQNSLKDNIEYMGNAIKITVGVVEAARESLVTGIKKTPIKISDFVIYILKFVPFKYKNDTLRIQFFTGTGFLVRFPSSLLNI
jgi:hypothetical protein